MRDGPAVWQLSFGFGGFTSVGYPCHVQGRNSKGRLPFLSQLDVYIQHQIRVARPFRLTLSANVINLLDQGTATNYHPTGLFSGQDMAVDETDFFHGIDTQALIAE